ncbi:MAG: MalY/PatB family protein [Bacillota bacterium]|nr:MalY/PatB family protein [Bacillota bacterium]MDW7683556.1 MalY/PatB family protein [Bacillota bacterium]
MGYDLNKFIDRSNTNSVKWEYMQNVDPQATADTIPLWVADMDFPCAEPIIKALHERVDRKIFGYSSHDHEDYYNAVRGWFQRRFDWDIDAADLVFSPGVVPAVGFLLDILTEPGDGVLIQRPVYHPFTRLIETRNRVLINNPLTNRNGYYEMDFADLERKVKDPRTKLMILCSPHNPVGRVWKEDELRTLGRICLDNDVFIISDEIHCDLVRRGVKHTPLETLFPEYRDRIITTTAPSKTFNLAGMQVSNIIIHAPKIRAKWQAYVKDQLGIMWPNTLSIVAAQAAYCQGEGWLEKVLDYVDGNLAFLQDFLEKHVSKARCSPIEGTYLAWVDFTDYGYSQDELIRRMYREAKVLVLDGTLFGEEGEGFIRINTACPRDILKEALERIAKIVR